MNFDLDLNLFHLEINNKVLLNIGLHITKSKSCADCFLKGVDDETEKTSQTYVPQNVE